MKIVIAVLVLLISLGVILSTIQKEDIKIYESGCDGIETCGIKIEVDNMFFYDENRTIEKSEINKDFLNEYCIEIEKDAYSCKQYLVLFE
jgi:hypothetical protein